MQSHQSSFGNETTKAHRRTASMGKSMPVTSLLLNFPPPTMSSLRTSSHHMRDGSDRGAAGFPDFFVEQNKPAVPSATSAADSKKTTKSSNPHDLESEDELNIDQDYEILVSECSSDAGDGGNNGSSDDDDEAHISLIGNSIFYTPCLTCTGAAPPDLANRPSAINEMCRRLCTDECRLRLSLAGFEPPSEAELKSKEALAQYLKETMSRRPQLQHTCSEATLKGYPIAEEIIPVESIETELPSTPSTSAPVRPPSGIAIQRKQFLTDLLMANAIADSDTDSNFADEESEESSAELRNIIASARRKNSAEAAKTAVKIAPIDNGLKWESVNPIVDPHEFAMLKDFREKFEIAEALAKTSAMTSTSQMKQRLAARKLEMDRDHAKGGGGGGSGGGGGRGNNMRAQKLGAPSLTDDRAAATTSAADALPHVQNERDNNSNNDNGDDDNSSDDDDDSDEADIVATAKTRQRGNEFEPPRDLLLYLVRMGSFNSAPKINNIDSQDDDLKIPKGLNNDELLQHVKLLRGNAQAPLLTRYFLKSSPLAAQMVSNDITDGLRSLKFNSVSRVCSAPMSAPNHIRLLQWNILSQTLGQNNDGFVRCPEEALTWENRKFLIVQEILQNSPDIICLQEVDHFKFLQNILGSQDYEGIFFPKPDSPCLYIEENNGPDGCAIFYKRDRFELKNYDTRILEVWRVQSNQVAIAAHFRAKATDKEFCVCTTHLKARHGSLLSKLRNEQGRDLIRFVNQFADERPVLLCGDFNAEPIEPVYTTILNSDNLNLSSAYADIKAESDECNNENGSSANENEKALTAEPAQEDAQNAGDRVQKSIQHEPPYTTWKIREDGEVCHTIDYVFYSKDKFKVKNCLEFPEGDEIGKNRTPSFQYPSDHFSLVCDFEIVDTKPQ